MSGDATLTPYRFNKARTRLIVRDAAGGGPLFIIEGGYNPDAVGRVEKALRELGMQEARARELPVEGNDCLKPRDCGCAKCVERFVRRKS
jgi:hypothetical protein